MELYFRERNFKWQNYLSLISHGHKYLNSSWEQEKGIIIQFGKCRFKCVRSYLHTPISTDTQIQDQNQLSLSEGPDGLERLLDTLTEI